MVTYVFAHTQYITRDFVLAVLLFVVVKVVSLHENRGLQSPLAPFPPDPPFVCFTLSFKQCIVECKKKLVGNNKQ